MKYKITFIEQNQQKVMSEIISSEIFPSISTPHYGQSGYTGQVIKVELLMEADPQDTFDCSA